MHQPRPHGTFGDTGSQEDMAAAELLARRLTNLKSVSGVDSLKMARTLPSGAIAIAVDMGGVLRVIIQKPVEPSPEAPGTDGLAKGFIPMMFSGAIDNGTVWPRSGVSIKLSEQCRKRLSGYGKDKQQPPKVVKLQRFEIEHHQMVSELMPQEPSSWLVTQYSNQRPTWYSGGMAQVMQIVGGYGIQTLKELPDDKIERARFTLPEKVAKRIEREIGSLRLPGYAGLPVGDGKFQYDYKFNQTHGVGFDSGGKPWLLRINSRGVYAMPLPLVPATTTSAFREYIEEVVDAEILWILDRFGGMPSGEGFPILSKDFESWRRAGVIVKVCDAGGFYQNLMYTSAIGWSFNERGTEGFNTCYDYDDSGVGVGKAFKLKLNLQPAKDSGKLPESFKLDDPVQAERLSAYLAMLYRQLGGNTARELAIKYKLRRVPVASILARAGKDGPGEIDHWDNLEAEPIASHSGGISEVGRGNLWHWGKPKNQPQIKFPEPFMAGCISHDFGPVKPGAVPAGTIVRCNTIMFGYYIGDQLKVAKYFLDQRQYKRDVEDNYEDCMIVGSWERTITEGSTSFMGNFYTTDFDEREAAAPTTTVIKTVGTDLGYDSKPFFSFNDFFARPGTLWRNRYFKHKVETNRSENYSRSIALCVPYLARNALLHARVSSVSGTSKTNGVSMYSIRDPYSYQYFTNDFIWAWVGGPDADSVKVPVWPMNGNPVWVVKEFYGPNLCSDFADQGPWIPALPADYTWLIHPNRMQWMHSGGGGPPSVVDKYTSETGKGSEDGLLQVSILEGTGLVHKKPSNLYFLFSPDEYVGVFYRDAVRVVAGDTVYASVSEEDPEAPKQRKRFGFSSLVDHKAATHFIGVIHE